MATGRNLGRLHHFWRGSLAAAQTVLKPLVEQVGRVLLGSWGNVLLVCVPAGVALNCVSGPALATFIVNFLAAVGLLGLGDAALESITSKLGTFYGSLIYISTSNLMQMISSTVLLVQDQDDLLQESLIGSLLANILLLPALSIFHAAYRRRRMSHNYSITRDYTLLLLLAVGGFMIPTIFDALTILPTASTAAASRATSVFLMLAYGAYLVSQLSTHRDIFDRFMEQRNDEAHESPVSIRVASAVFVVATVLLYFCVDFVVASLQQLESDGLATFTGFVLIPILNSDVAAVEQAGRSMDLVLASTIGKCIQSALLVAPLLVVIAWGLGNDDLTLSFGMWAVALLFMSVFVLNTLAASGSFKWLHGLMLLALYAVLALCLWFYPREATAS